MNEVLRKVNISRTPELIAAEINNIKEQTRRTVLYNSIEIGRRLTEAKELVNHGEWGQWLECKVEYSKSTANNLMKIFKEYGADQTSLLGDNAKNQAFGNLSYSQAVALLGIPSDEREEFIEKNKIDEMSTRELQKAIKERDYALKALEDANKKAKELENKSNKDKDRLAEIEKEKEAIKAELDDFTGKFNEEVEENNKKLIKASHEIEEYKEKIKELNERPIEVIQGATAEEVEAIRIDTENKYKQMLDVARREKEEAERVAEELKNKITTTVIANEEDIIKFKFIFDKLVNNFKDILVQLNTIKKLDIEAYDKYKGATNKLINQMIDKL